MQFQVPQFIDTEDKIVGPLSLRQFGFVAAGGILSAILYFTAVPWLWVLGSVIIFGVAIALAFVKIEGRPFASVLISAFNFYWRPQTYIWQPEKPAVRVSQHETRNKGVGSGALLEDLLAKSTTKIVHAPTRTAQVFSPRPAAPVTPAKPVTPITSVTPVTTPSEQPKPISRETVSAGSALHKSWEYLQTGAPFAKKTSDKQFLDKKMAERYQIFQRVAGDRHAAKRVDYR